MPNSVVLPSSTPPPVLASVSGGVLCEQPDIPVGGRLTLFLREWESVTTNPWVLSTLRDGHHPNWKSSPPPFLGIRRTPVPASVEKREALRAEVQSLLDKSAIEVVPKGQEHVGYYSTYFLVTKKDGGFRPILNLRGLNGLIEVPTFKMETLRSVIASVSPGEWLTSIDLKDAYLHVPMHPEFRKYLRFSFDGVCYEFRVLPFGISTAPRVFTKLMLVPAQTARAQARLCHPYLDDWLLRALSELLARENTQALLDLLTRLGWVINIKKSDLTPSQEQIFLGTRFDTAAGLVSLSPDRITKIRDFALQFLRTARQPALHWLQLLGHLASTVDVVWRARLRLRPVQQALRSMWSQPQGYYAMLTTPEWVVPHIQWWTETGNLSMDPPTPTLTIQTDASLFGWGGVLEGSTAAGQWTGAESQLHINVLELRAVRKVCKHFLHRIRGHVVRVELDNRTAMSYILKQGGTVSPSLLQETWDFLLWCDQFDIQVVPVYIPGEDNIRADALSRRILAPHEWKLHPEIFETISRLFGSFEVDLFASGATNQIPVFCSRIPDPRALSNDAFRLDWTDRVLWAFPPLPLVPRVLSKLSTQPARLLVLLAPLWSAQSWFPDVLRFLAMPPVLLPFRPDLLTQNGAPHRNPRIQWVAWPLSGIPSRNAAFRQQLRTQFWLQGGIRQTFSMRIDGPVIRAGVAVGGFSIPFLRI